METPMLFELQAAKAIEYFLVFGFLLLFVPFWRYVAPRRAVEEEAELEAAPTLRPETVRVAPPLHAALGWFRVPEEVAFHPGHAWAMAAPGADGEVKVGIDDFTRAVVGHITDAKLPRVGAVVRQGEPLWTLQGEAGPITMVSPVDGMVVAANPAARLGAVDADPYGDGWVLRVQAPRYDANEKQLLRGAAARAWMADAESRLRSLVSPELGPAMADGGVPVHGIAATLDDEAYRRLAREFFFDSNNERTKGTTAASA